MRRRIPSTGALIAFEAAARHEGISRAAGELGQTEGAVSRQIARLETMLGVPLFDRVRKRVQLTAAGRAYYRQVQETLDRLEKDTLGVMAQPEHGGVLELAVIPTFANKWLIPRLPGFHHLHPEITINMSERADPFLFPGTKFDAALHFDHPAWTGAARHALFVEELIPVCSPTLLIDGRIAGPAHLARLTLLHKTTRPEAWKLWCANAGWSLPNPMRGPRFDLYSMLVEAARAGMGVAIVPRLYVEPELVAGTLVAPLDHAAAGDKRYCVIHPEGRHDAWPLNVFLDWIGRAAADYRERRHPCSLRRPARALAGS